MARVAARFHTHPNPRRHLVVVHLALPLDALLELVRLVVQLAIAREAALRGPQQLPTREGASTRQMSDGQKEEDAKWSREGLRGALRGSDGQGGGKRRMLVVERGLEARCVVLPASPHAPRR